jgi:hypothetical protein
MSLFIDFSTVEDETKRLETSGTNHLMTRHHIPEEQRPQPQSCESLKTRSLQAKEGLKSIFLLKSEDQLPFPRTTLIPF